MAVDGVAGGGPAQVPTPFYSRLQEWILQQQEYEATYSKPAPLTAAQRKLLSELELTVTPAPTEPEVGDNNWIGILLEYRAANQLYPGDSAVEFTEEAVAAVPGHPGPVRWRCQARIEESAGVPFPSGTPPSFARKKDAKQFAARCAVEWLRANGHMPADGVRFPKAAVAAAAPPPPPPKQQQQGTKRRASPGTSTSNNPSPRPNNGSSPSTSSKRSPRSSLSAATEASPSSFSPNSSPFGGDERAPGQEVAELCGNLGWQQPRYVLTEDPQTQGFWSGYPEFGHYGPSPEQVPASAGRVEGAYGKKLARQLIAEGVLPYIRRVWEERQAGTRDFMSRLGPTK
ncbi:hypothetical protein DL768_001975 [Monosporascus sp. mg162]|nr:hypothetical protein DL768_001975 [Monosporascus sp. mg162]